VNSRPVVGAPERPPTERKAKVVTPGPSTPLHPMFPGVPAVNPTPLLIQFAGLAVKKVPGRVGTILPSTVALSGFRTVGSTFSDTANPLIGAELFMFTATTNFVPTAKGAAADPKLAGVAGQPAGVAVVVFTQTEPPETA
jgi:hypothetical protein